MSASRVLPVGQGPRHGERSTAAGSSRSGRLLAGLGQMLLTLGLVVLLFGAYELWVTGLFTAHEQTRLRRELTATWQRGAVPARRVPTTGAAPAAPQAPRLGAALALLYLPTLWKDEPKVVVEGVGVPDLKKGPGHLPGSAQPGGLGNAVLSGHRTTYGAPFGQLDRLRPGDPVLIRTRAGLVRYRVTGSAVVLPSAVEVTYPVPGRSGVAPTASLLTLTTCTPRFSAARRLVVRGVLVGTAPAPAGPAGG